jgi:hypothetical protein
VVEEVVEDFKIVMEAEEVVVQEDFELVHLL